MKVIKQDFSKNHLRVVERFAYFPIKLYISMEGDKWIFLKRYYQLQLDSYWGKGWLKQENSFNEHGWDFKWDDKYIASWMSKEDENKVKIKHPPMYANSFTENDLPDSMYR